MKKKNYVRRPWAFEEETLATVRSLAQALIDCTLSIRKIEEMLTHSPGCIVMKGPKRQYAYWQYYENGKHIFRFVKGKALEEARRMIETFKRLKERLRNLRYNLRAHRCALRHYRLDPDQILADFEEKRRQLSEKEAQRQASLAAAQTRKYADSHKHFTDRGKVVASKSEMIIANELARQNLRYDYEKPLQLPDRRVLPDFTLYLADGTEVYWEHAGMMDDPRYAANFRAKLSSYEKAGYYLNDRLIVTRDENGTVNLDIVRRFIQLYSFQKVEE